ncbi:hypothetical protein BDW69DRAFT_200261 [Aspergillus filifer]
MNSSTPSDRIIRPTDPDSLVLEAWGQVLMVGSLLVMATVTIANMKKHILLHMLILAEVCIFHIIHSPESLAANTVFSHGQLILALPHATWIFTHEPAYGWHLSASAISFNMSWSLHNVIAWMKNRPFFSKKVSMIYVATVVLVQPYWVLEIYANFTYFNNINKVFERMRPLEPLFRDPWWVYTTLSLSYTIKKEYSFSLTELISISPRFGIMLGAMCLSFAFVIVDACSVLGVFKSANLPKGLQPFWKLSFVFKCLCNTVILDDFKTALDRMRGYWFQKQGSGQSRGLYRDRAGDGDVEMEMLSGSELGKEAPVAIPRVHVRGDKRSNV